MIHVGCSVEALGTRLHMRFIEIEVINCINPQNCLINYLDPVLLSRHGRVTQNIKLIYFALPHDSSSNCVMKIPTLTKQLHIKHNILPFRSFVFGDPRRTKNTRFSEMNYSALSPNEFLYMCIFFLK